MSDDDGGARKGRSVAGDRSKVEEGGEMCCCKNYDDGDAILMTKATMPNNSRITRGCKYVSPTLSES